MSVFLSNRIRAKVKRTSRSAKQPLTVVFQSKFMFEEAECLCEIDEWVRQWLGSTRSKSCALGCSWPTQEVKFYDGPGGDSPHLSICGEVDKVSVAIKHPDNAPSQVVLTWSLLVSEDETDAVDKVRSLYEAAGVSEVLWTGFGEGPGTQAELIGTSPEETKRRAAVVDPVCAEIVGLAVKHGEFWLGGSYVDDMESTDDRSLIGRAIQHLQKQGKIAEYEERPSPDPLAKGRKLKVFRLSLAV